MASSASPALVDYCRNSNGARYDHGITNRTTHVKIWAVKTGGRDSSLKWASFDQIPQRRPLTHPLTSLELVGNPATMMEYLWIGMLPSTAGEYVQPSERGSYVPVGNRLTVASPAAAPVASPAAASSPSTPTGAPIPATSDGQPAKKRRKIQTFAPISTDDLTLPVVTPVSSPGQRSYYVLYDFDPVAGFCKGRDQINFSMIFFFSEFFPPPDPLPSFKATKAHIRNAIDATIQPAGPSTPKVAAPASGGSTGATPSGKATAAAAASAASIATSLSSSRRRKTVSISAPPIIDWAPLRTNLASQIKLYQQMFSFTKDETNLQALLRVLENGDPDLALVPSAEYPALRQLITLPNDRDDRSYSKQQAQAAYNEAISKWPNLVTSPAACEMIGITIRTDRLFVPYRQLRGILAMFKYFGPQGKWEQSWSGDVIKFMCEILDVAMPDPIGMPSTPRAPETVVLSAIRDYLYDTEQHHTRWVQSVREEISPGARVNGTSIAGVMDTWSNRSDIASAAVCIREVADYILMCQVTASENSMRFITQLRTLLDRAVDGPATAAQPAAAQPAGK